MTVKAYWLPHILKLCYFTYFFGVGCVQTFYSVIMKTAGFNNSQIGTVQGMGMIGGILGPILVGMLADKTKRSRIILTLCVIFSIIMHSGPIVIITFSSIGKPSVIPPEGQSNKNGMVLTNQSASTKLVVILTMIQLFSTLFDQGAKSQLDGMVYKIIDLLKKEGIEIDYGKQRMFCPIGLCFSSLVSGILLDKIKNVAKLPFKEELLLAIICVASGVACVSILISVMPDAETTSSPMVLREVAGIFRNSVVLMVLILFLINQLAFNIVRHYEALYVISLGGSKMVSGLCAAFFRIGEIMMMYFSSTIIAAFGSEKICIALCQLFFSLTVFSYSFADTPWISFNYSFLIGFTNGIQWPCISRVVKTGAPPHLISSYLSILVTCGKVGAVIANKIGGAISHVFGYKVNYMISASTYSFSGLVYVLFWFISYRYRKKSDGSFIDIKEEKMLVDE